MRAGFRAAPNEGRVQGCIPWGFRTASYGGSGLHLMEVLLEKGLVSPRVALQIMSSSQLVLTIVSLFDISV